MSRRDRGERVSLYVRHIPDSTRPDDLRYVFEKYGAVRDIYIPMDYYTRRPRGFAYVEYEDPRDSEEAMRELDGYRLHGRELEIEFAQGDRKSANQMRSKYGAPSRGYDDRDRGTRRRRSRSRSPDRDRERDRYRTSRRRRSRSRSRSRSRDKERERRTKRRRSSEERRKSRSRSRSKSKERKEESRSRSGSPAGEVEENGKDHSKSEENGADEYDEETAD